jgi:predicted O-linked N-acetylglucosamine transferase (SPINDLY family)
MNDWIAYNTKDYISKALKYSSNFNLLNDVRSNLRTTSRKSALFDSTMFSKDFSDCLNKIVDFYKKENN